MKRRFVIKASLAAKRRAQIKAASTADMLDTFQKKLAEVGIESSTDVQASNELREVIVNPSDYDEIWIDNEGSFGEPGAQYSLGEIKEYWNGNNSSDPILTEYSDFNTWWADTQSVY